MGSVKISKKPFLMTSPHSGETVPDETPWLKGLPETLLMFDVDRFVDRLYQPVIETLGIEFVKTEWHRYAVDLNRLPDDVDADSVAGHKNRSGLFSRGLHWSITTAGERIMPKAMNLEMHKLLIEKYFEPFHRDVKEALARLRGRGAKVTYHLDAHSMPSIGTNEHRDPGERRADIVVGNCDGKSCSPFFTDLVIDRFAKAGFKVALNWPYRGGRLTEAYGRPEIGQEAIQVELNRALYMSETTRQIDKVQFPLVQLKLRNAVQDIFVALPDLP